MIIISPLKNSFFEYNPQGINRLNQIWHQELGDIWMPDISVTEVNKWLLEWCNSNAVTLPLAHVAIADDNLPVGMCSLQINDGILPDLSPWLGDLCVDSAYQKQGIGKMLIESTKLKASELGFTKLYLFAFDPKVVTYYSKLGWNTIATDQLQEHSVVVMEINL